MLLMEGFSLQVLCEGRDPTDTCGSREGQAGMQQGSKSLSVSCRTKSPSTESDTEL